MQNINIEDMSIEGFDPEIIQLIMAGSNNIQETVNHSEDLELDENSLRTKPTLKKNVTKSKVKEEPVEVSKVSEDVIDINHGRNIASQLINENILSIFSSKLNEDYVEENSIDFRSDFKLKFEADDKIDIVVVGCGGNGSRIVNLLAQQMYSNKSIQKVYLIDDDKVEVKNLTRQLFYEFEVGEFKSQALADRYNMLYDLKIIPINLKFDIGIGKIDRFSQNNLVIFDCVDNKAGRESIERYFKNYSDNILFASIAKDYLNNNKFKSITVISCGNQKDHGQVHVGHASKNIKSFKDLMFSKICLSKTNNFESYHRIRRKLATISSKCILSLVNANIDDSKIIHLSPLVNANINNDKITYLSPFLEYNKTFEDSKESVSCADMEIAEEQSMAINSTIAQLAFNVFFEMLIGNNGIKNNIIFANLSNDFSSQRCNTKESVVDYYIKSIFGKNIFFEKELCLEQICKSYDLFIAIINKMNEDCLKIFNNDNYNNDALICFCINAMAQNVNLREEDTYNNFQKTCDDYFSFLKHNLNSFIEEKYSKDYSKYYMEIELLLISTINLLDAYLGFITDYIYSKNYNIAYIFNSAIKLRFSNFIESVMNDFNERYSEISSKSNYEYFVKE
jgi:molybdopterin/thiamine biosynthesis adenylyltransferase